MIAAIVAPAGVRSIARMRACLVSGRVEVFGDECADRGRGFDLLVVCAAERVEALDFDLDFVMGSSDPKLQAKAYASGNLTRKTRAPVVAVLHTNLAVVRLNDCPNNRKAHAHSVLLR